MLNDLVISNIQNNMYNYVLINSLKKLKLKLHTVICKNI